LVIEEKFGKHTVYTIQGSDKHGEFKVIRRYSDFDKIRSVLQVRWLGVYIPPLPPKKAVNNLDTEFVEKRLHGLHTFCKSVSRVYHLHYSEEYQAFIRSPNNDVDKLLHPFQKIKHKEIIAKYTTVFAHLAEKELNSKTIPKIFVFRMMYLSKLKEKLKSYKKYSKRVGKARANYYSQLAAFHEKVGVPYERHVISEIHGHTQGKSLFDDPSNPQLDEAAKKMAESATRKSLENIYEYIREKLLQIEALSEAIDQRDKYHAMRSKAQDKHKSETEDLGKVKSGKFTMKTIFSKKTADDEITEISRNISSATKDIEDLNMLNDMITLVLAYHTIPKFIKSNLGEFAKLLRNTGETELISLSSVEEYWNCLLGNENLQKTQID